MSKFEKDIIDGVARRMEQLEISQSEIGRQTGEHQTNVSRWVKRGSSPTLNSIAPLVDFLGGRVMWPDKDGMSIAINVDVKGKGSGEYQSVPVISWQTLGRYPRRAISKDEAIQFVLQHHTHKSVAGHDNLVAVVLGEHREGMAPTVCPGDTIFIDTGVRSLSPTAISVLCDPTGELRVCRVDTKKAGPDTLFLVSEDAKPGQVDVYSLQSDYGDRSLEAVVIGEVTGLLR